MPFLKRTFSSLLLVCWLWALALAASPTLHAWAHGEDAGHEDHECVAKLIATGGCDAPAIAPALVVAPVAFVLVALPLRDTDAPVVLLIGGPSERGPPVVGV